MSAKLGVPYAALLKSTLGAVGGRMSVGGDVHTDVDRLTGVADAVLGIRSWRRCARCDVDGWYCLRGSRDAFRYASPRVRKMSRPGS